jgi:hypothetical protein
MLNIDDVNLQESVMRATQRLGYPCYHQSRVNLLLHIISVPLFLAGNVTFLAALAEHWWLAAIAAAGLIGVSLAAQAFGHSKESVPAEPFTGAINAISRILREQWVTFPKFVLSGAWARALRKQ